MARVDYDTHLNVYQMPSSSELLILNYYLSFNENAKEGLERVMFRVRTYI